MALWLCRGCTAAFAVGLPACPQCGGTDHEEEHMPKISRASGVTYEAGHEPDGAVAPEVVEDEPQGAVQAAPKAAKRTTRKAAAEGA